MAEKTVHLTAGTSFFIEDGETIPVFIEVEDCISMGGEIGQLGAFVEATTTKDLTKKYIAGLSDQGDLTISFLWSGSVNQTNFKTAALAGASRPAKIEFSNTGAGAVLTASFDAVMSGFTMGDPTPDGILTANVSLKPSNFVWS